MSTPRPRRRARHRVLALMPLSALALGLLPAGPAAAVKPVIRESGTFTDQFDDDVCGVEVDIDVVGAYRDLVFPVPGADGNPFLLRSTATATETWTTQAGEGVVTVQVRSRVLEQHAELIADTVWRFTALYVAQVVFRDADGRVLLRENGSQRFQVDFDTLGDGQPGGVQVPGTFVELRRSGRFVDEEQLCVRLQPELGPPGS